VKCRFVSKYKLTGDNEQFFKCSEDAQSAGLCIFHDGEHFSEYRQQIIDRLTAKLEESSSSNSPLYCIGYNFPSMDISFTFSVPVYFSHSSFRGEANFSGSIFKLAADFSNTTFYSTADFSDCIFEGEGNFLSANFTKKALFIKTVFELKSFFNQVLFDGGESDFSRTIFKAEARFFNAVFNCHINFARAQFHRDARFVSSKFNQDAIFFNTVFGGNTSFFGTSFQKRANFVVAKFNGNATFSYAIFEDLAIFEDANFMKIADFSHARFNQSSNFGRAHLRTYSNFSHADFEITKFIDTKFGIVDFIAVEFTRVDFIRCNFCGKADFSFGRFEKAYFIGKRVLDADDTFSDKVDFTGCRFDEAHFNQICFSKGANFYQSLLNEASFSEIRFRQESNFNFVVFGEPGRIIFDVVDLSNVSFLNTDITDVRFGQNVCWGSGDDEFRIIDEIKAVKGVKNIRLGEVVAVYRNLRENYEDTLRYEVADKFFKREMELKRRYREKEDSAGTRVVQNNRLRQHLSITGIYHSASEYGLNYTRPVFIVLILLSVPILYSLWQINPTMQPSLSYPGFLAVVNSTSKTLASTLRVTESELSSYLLNLALLTVIGILIIPAIKNSFVRRLRK
jgi:uncharacterized protein YjbI with pentapeptide repeats